MVGKRIDGEVPARQVFLDRRSERYRVGVAGVGVHAIDAVGGYLQRVPLDDNRNRSMIGSRFMDGKTGLDEGPLGFSPGCRGRHVDIAHVIGAPHEGIANKPADNPGLESCGFQNLESGLGIRRYVDERAVK